MNKLLTPPGPARQARRSKRVELSFLSSSASELINTLRIVRTAGSLILKSGGTIRGIKNWGVFSLPKRTRKHQAQHDNGHYFIMRYDASSRIQDDVRKTLGLDPRMIKFSSVKLGDGTLESLSKIGGSIPWDTREEF
jgi:small subunit ribosomal protein S6